MTTANITNIPAPRVAFIDERTGLMAREWYRFFLNLFVLTGSGTSDISVTDLAVAPNVENTANLLPNVDQNAQLSAYIAQFDDAMSRMQGAYLEPHFPSDALQFDPLSFAAPAPLPVQPLLTGFVSTIDATITTIATITVPASTTILIWANVVARRTGGAAGTAEDGAGYVLAASYKNVAGTATEIGENSVFSAEDQAGWAVTLTPSGANALLQVTGAANNNVDWYAQYQVYTVS